MIVVELVFMIVCIAMITSAFIWLSNIVIGLRDGCKNIEYKVHSIDLRVDRIQTLIFTDHVTKEASKKLLELPQKEGKLAKSEAHKKILSKKKKEWWAKKKAEEAKTPPAKKLS
jgi:hypothetical protein